MAFGVADVSLLAPFFAKIIGAHRAARGGGAEGAGGVVDVGANVGATAEAMLGAWSDHGLRFYLSVVGRDDALHPAYASDRLAFAFLLEASPATRSLLQRRFDAAQWGASNARIFAVAASNASGTARFCFEGAGSGQSGLGLAQSSSGAASNCSDVQTTTVAELVDREAGAAARVFFLKIDVEGAEALVLAGAAPLFAQQRISYVLFENHAKWRQAQEAAGVPAAGFVGVGAAVRALAAHGYRCFYAHGLGLIPFVAAGTPQGEAARPAADCHEGLPFCARWRLYDRQFWSNVLCGAPSETLWLDWLADAMVAPDETRERLLRRP